MLIWIILFLLLILIESFIGDFTALTVSIGALAGIAAALLLLPFPVQIGIFGIVAFSSFIVLRPFLHKRVIPPHQDFTQDSFIGKKAKVLDKITSDDKGRVKIFGEIWFAESMCDINPGESVIITEIEGTTLKVIPESQLTDLTNQSQNIINKKIIIDKTEKEEI